MSRLALGTVQFGLRYGVANRDGRVEREAAEQILRLASANGIDTLDTAIAYGDSEEVLGQIGIERWRVVSKLPPLPEAEVDVVAWTRRHVTACLARLRVPALHAMLLHRSRDFCAVRGSQLYGALDELRRAGKIGKLGVSIYGPEELEAIPEGISLDLVQAPLSVVDRRLLQSGWLARLADSGVEIHVRSVFLQGLLLMTPAARPGYFSRWQPLWRRWEEWLQREGLSPLQACVGFALAQRGVARVVVGVDSPEQLRAILAGARELRIPVPDELASTEPDLVNPSRWTLQ